MENKIDYAIIIILLAGVIMTILGFFSLIIQLRMVGKWHTTVHEWGEYIAGMNAQTLYGMYFWLYFMLIGIFISIAGNCIAVAGLLLKKDKVIVKKMKYLFAVILIAGVIITISGYFLLINHLVVNNKWGYLLWEWYEIEISMGRRDLQGLHFWFYFMFSGIIISLTGNGISVARILIQKES